MLKRGAGLLLMVLACSGLAACSSEKTKLQYLDSRLTAPLVIPPRLDRPEIQPQFVLPEDAAVDAHGRISGAGNQGDADIERPPRILSDGEG